MAAAQSAAGGLIIDLLAAAGQKKNDATSLWIKEAGSTQKSTSCPRGCTTQSPYGENTLFVRNY